MEGLGSCSGGGGPFRVLGQAGGAVARLDSLGSWWPLLDCWLGLLGRLIAGSLDFWIAGSLDRWIAGLLAICWLVAEEVSTWYL